MFYDMGATSTVATIVGKFLHQPFASGFVECEPGVLSDNQAKWKVTLFVSAVYVVT